MTTFRPRLLDDLRHYNRSRLASDVGAGLTVGVVALPLAMAFAIASGVKPEQGLITAIVGGLLVSMLGGSSVQIGGPAGAYIVIVYGIVQRYGITGLAISTTLAGVLLMIMGGLKLGALVRYIPVAIVIGFTNGIAVLIALSQVKDLLGLSIERMPADFFSMLAALGHHLPSLDLRALAVGLLSLLIVVAWPKSCTMPQAGHDSNGAAQALKRWVSHLPGTLVALLVATLVSVMAGLDVPTIGSRFGGIPSSLPTPHWTAIGWSDLQQLVIPTITIALLGAVESLLCARVADNLRPEQERHEPNQELMAQGVANIITPMFGGIPTTGTIARTVTNVRAGATSPVAGMVHALTLLLVVVAAAPLAEHVPLAALAGILLFVAWNMGEWKELSRLRQFSLSYRITLLGTFALTVIFDLTVAVEVGLLLACGFFIYRMGQLFEIRPHRTDAPVPERVQVLELFGSLFFGAVGKLEALPSRIAPGTRRLVLDMHRLISLDNTGLEALEQLHTSLRRRGVELVLAQPNPQPLTLMERSGFADQLGPAGIVPTLELALAQAPLDPPP